MGLQNTHNENYSNKWLSKVVKQMLESDLNNYLSLSTHCNKYLNERVSNIYDYMRRELCFVDKNTYSGIWNWLGVVEYEWTGLSHQYVSKQYYHFSGFELFMRLFLSIYKWLTKTIQFIIINYIMWWFY